MEFICESSICHLYVITPYVCFFSELACNVTGLPNGCRTAAAMDNILHMMQARHSFVR